MDYNLEQETMSKTEAARGMADKNGGAKLGNVG